MFRDFIKCTTTFDAKNRWGVRSSVSIPRQTFTKVLNTCLSAHQPRWVLAAVMWRKLLIIICISWKFV